MEILNLAKLLGDGWVYCPRCNADSMVVVEDGWHCPWCGIGMAMHPTHEGTMLWSEPLTTEEVTREMNHLRNMLLAWATEQAKAKPQVPPWRVRFCYKLANIVAWPLACKVVGVIDKKQREVTGEQAKQENQVL